MAKYESKETPQLVLDRINQFEEQKDELMDEIAKGFFKVKKEAMEEDRKEFLSEDSTASTKEREWCNEAHRLELTYDNYKRCVAARKYTPVTEQDRFEIENSNYCIKGVAFNFYEEAHTRTFFAPQSFAAKSVLIPLIWSHKKDEIDMVIGRAIIDIGEKEATFTAEIIPTFGEVAEKVARMIKSGVTRSVSIGTSGVVPFSIVLGHKTYKTSVVTQLTELSVCLLGGDPDAVITERNF